MEGVLFFGYFHIGESVSLERKIESSIFLCLPRDLNILGKSCTIFCDSEDCSEFVPWT